MSGDESQSILAPSYRVKKQKRNDPTAEENKANKEVKKPCNVVSIGGHPTGMLMCSCPHNAKAVAFRYLINQIPEENLDSCWKDVLDVMNKYKKS